MLSMKTTENTEFTEGERDPLTAKVIGCALKSAVLRILPRQAELQLEREWDEIVSCGATA